MALWCLPPCTTSYQRGPVIGSDVIYAANGVGPTSPWRDGWGRPPRCESVGIHGVSSGEPLAVIPAAAWNAAVAIGPGIVPMVALCDDCAEAVRKVQGHDYTGNLDESESQS